MNRWLTILLAVFALGAIIFLSIYEPLTLSTREKDASSRDGAVLRLDPAKVQTIHLITGDEEVEIKRRGDGWRLGPKVKDRADNAAVKEILAAATRLTFYDRIDGADFHKDKDWHDYGLEKPKRRIEFEGDRKVTLYLGKDAASENRIYVRSSDGRDVYLVDDEIMRIAFRNASELRDRRLTDLSPDQVDRVIVRRPGGEIELRREAGGWRIVKPLHVMADDRKVAEYLQKLLDLRIEEFVAEDSGDLSVYGITEGQNEITLFAEGSERHQTLRLGPLAEGKPLYGQFTMRDSVYRLPPETAALLQVSTDDLRDRRLLAVNPDVVDRIRLRAGETEFTVDREGDGWILREGKTSRPASSAVVGTLFDALARTTADAYAPAVGDSLAGLGLQAPILNVDFLSVLSENTPESTAGEQRIAALAFGNSADGKVWVRQQDAPEAALVSDSILAALPISPDSWAAPRGKP